MDDAGADRSATFADSKSHFFFHRDGGNELTDRAMLSPGITISTPSGNSTPRHIRRAEIELRAISLEERRVTASFVLGQHVNLSLELLVRVHGSGSC